MEEFWKFIGQKYGNLNILNSILLFYIYIYYYLYIIMITFAFILVISVNFLV